MAFMGAFGSVSAQSNVTVYGTLDAGVSSINGTKPAGIVTKLSSGQQSYSRFGFAGTEDMGDGLKALFLLEAGVELNRGNTGLDSIDYNVRKSHDTNLFGSQAYVGLTGNFGTLKLGRQFTPLYNAYGAIDPFMNGFAANINNFFGINNLYTSDYQRMSNAVVYEAPDNLNGFKASAAYGFGGFAGDLSAQSQVGASLGYLNGPLTVSYAYHEANNEKTTVEGALTDTFRTNFIGAAYDFGLVKLHAAYDQNEQGPRFKTEDYLFGLTLPVGAHAVFADYTHKKNKIVDSADADQYAVGYTYNLSKRTNVYTAYTYVQNQSNSSIDTETPGKSVGTIQAGLRHTF